MLDRQQKPRAWNKLIVCVLWLVIIGIVFGIWLFYGYQDKSMINEQYTISSRKLLSSNITSNVPSTNIFADHCCICFDEEFETMDRSTFENIFHFYCQHASTSVCHACWLRLLHEHQGRVSCPLCRAHRMTPPHSPTTTLSGYYRASNLPYGHQDSQTRSQKLK